MQKCEFKGQWTVQIFPVFHSDKNTCSKYIWADDSVAITGTLTTDLWHLSYPVEMQQMK